MVLETEPILMVIVEVPAAMPLILKPLYSPPPMVVFSTVATLLLEELTEKSSAGRISFSI
jgi:hypothetical protein